MPGDGSLNVRRAVEADAALLLDWRNDPATRAASLSTAFVNRNEHERWFRAVLADPARILYVVMSADPPWQPIGMCRFDVHEDAAEVSINLSPAFRGRGLSGKVLSDAIAKFQVEVQRPLRLTATIRSANEPSIRLFERVGFRDVETVDGMKRFELAKRPD